MNSLILPKQFYQKKSNITNRLFINLNKVYKGGVLLNTIGIIAPKRSRANKSFFNKYKPDFIFIEHKLLRLVVAYDNQNYNRIFKKYNIKTAVKANDAFLKHTPVINLCTGKDFYEKNLIYFVTKCFKQYGLNSDNSTISIVFDDYSKTIEMLIIQASRLFKYMIIVSDDNISDKVNSLVNEYGIDIIIMSNEKSINSDISVELTSKNVQYSKDTIILNINSNILLPKEYNITMPKNIGFEVNKVALAEALSLLTKNIDNQI